MSWRIEVTDEDIDAIEERLGKSFDEERRSVLRCMDSCDVQACAGSGKTTTLVAKLAILAMKLPSGYRGICVLSHTNAARIELENSLGSYASRLCNYPHFVGTIQSFVDRFVAIPAMIEKYGIRPQAIDDEVFGQAMARHYYDIPRNKRYYIERRRQGIKTAQQIRYCFDEPSHICVYDQGKEKVLCGRGADTYTLILDAKEAATAEGYIGYHDAFALASWYLQEYPEIVEVIAHRFPLIFIDEMQDTNVFQSQVLNRIFRDSSVIQCFGDRNQTIYGAGSTQSDSGWDPRNILTINSSYRFGDSIAELCRNVCTDPQEIAGRADRPECTHTVFLFDDDSVEEVIPAFADRIEEEDLSEGPFKAIGAIKKRRDDSTRLSIPSYWPQFERKRRRSLVQPGLISYFQLAHQELTKRPYGDCGAARDLLVGGVTQVLRTQRDQKYTSPMLLRDLRELGETAYRIFSDRLFDWCNELLTQGTPGWDEVEVAIQEVLDLFGDGDLNDRALAFIHADTPDSRVQEAVEASNVYVRDWIKIEIDTIHSIKGQNHQGTLVLETYLRQVYDLPRLLPYIKGEYNNPDDPSKKRLPIIHVGMTRPTHLLCLAMHRDRVSDEDEQELIAAGWFIEDLTIE